MPRTMRWRVDATGYKWYRGRWLIGRVMERGLGRPTWYVPLEDQPSLYLQFAELDPGDPDAMLAFANEFGPLGLLEPIPDSEDSLGEPELGESIERWRSEIARMRETRALIDAVLQRDVGAIRDRVIEDGSSPPRWRSPAFDTVFLRTDRGLPLRGTWARDGQALPVPKSEIDRAGLVLVESINRAVVGHTRVALRFEPSGDQARFVLDYAPTNLLGALWLQLAGALASRREIRRCEFCGVPFELRGPEDAVSPKRRTRSDKKFCTTKCQQVAYNRTRAGRRPMP